MSLNAQAPALSETLYVMAKDFQPLIGAMLALITLAVGARIKFGYDRKMDGLTRAERRNALHSSVYMETLLLCQHIDELGRAMLATAVSKQPVTQELLDIYQLPVPTVYDAVVKDVGEMEVDVAADFVSFYAHYHMLVRDTPLLVRDIPERGIDYILGLILATFERAKLALAKVDALLDRQQPILPCTSTISDYLVRDGVGPEAEAAPA